MCNHMRKIVLTNYCQILSCNYCPSLIRKLNAFRIKLDALL